MSLKQYNGGLGRFVYDTADFQLGVDEDGREFLGYVGSETDGSRISIPDGIVDATGMFQDSAITSVPAMPPSVETADCMFAGCDNLTAGKFPAGLKSANYMYACCRNLEAVDGLPGSIRFAQGMFDGCSALKGVENLPAGLSDAKYMFMDCVCMKDAPALPAGLTSIDGMFAGCTGLESFPDVPADLAERTGCFDGCSVPAVDGARAVSMQDDFDDIKDVDDITVEKGSLVSLFNRAESEASDKKGWKSVANEIRTKAQEQQARLQRETVNSLDIPGLEDEGSFVPDF